MTCKAAVVPGPAPHAPVGRTVRMAVEEKLDPKSLVARIIAELQANPEAQRLLLQALLTNEFLGVPARLDRIEKDIAEIRGDIAEIRGDIAEIRGDVAELKGDVAELKGDVAELKGDVSDLKGDVSDLKGSDLEHRLHRRIRALASQALELRRPRVVQGPMQEPDEDFAGLVEEALEGGRITDAQEARIEATDFILRAQRRSDRATVWIAVEASNKVHAGDIERALASADALRAVFGVDTVAVAAGYGIDPPDAARAKAVGVRYLQAPPPRPR